MLDLNLFREEKGGDPQKIRESQRRRFANVEIVDEVIELDKAWRKRQFLLLVYLILILYSLCFFIVEAKLFGTEF